MKLNKTCAALAVLALAVGVPLVAQERDRSKVPDRYKWDLTAIYPSDDAWRAAKDKVVAEIPKMREFSGKLTSSPTVLADAMDFATQLNKEMARLGTYVGLASDQDMRVSSYQAAVQEMVRIGATFGAEVAYFEPEILKADPATIDKFIAQEPRLKVYAFYLHDILRRACPYTDRFGRTAARRILRDLERPGDNVWNLFECGIPEAVGDLG